MEVASGGSVEPGGDMPGGKENQHMNWSAARRSTRKAPDRCFSQTEQGQHRKPKQIKTSASASPTSTPSASTGCAKRTSHHDMDANTTTVLSNKRKRMTTRDYISLFNPKQPSTKGLVVKNAKQSSMPAKTNKMKESPFQKLQSLPNGCHPDFDNDHLCAVNKLREFWHKSQGAALVDDKETIMKTVLFIMSLLPDVCQPFLVVTTTSLSLWESEFKRFAPFINVVLYDGDKEARKSIQDLKFNTNGSSMMPHVFLAHPDALLEDIETVQCISWEAVIVECCQNSVLSFLKQLKQLPTDCRIVLLSSPPEDNLLEYKNLVAFLISEEEDNGDDVDDNALAILKAKFRRQIAYERKTDSSIFLEYWVPTCLSKVQLRLYSSILLTNSSVLQSQVATDSVGALGDIIQCLWKCCDHPCLIDEFPHNSLLNIDNETESADNRTCASGKLLLLDKMLREFRNKKSRVIVLFQSDGPGENKMGKILEEFVRHRFGSESYEHVQNHSAYSKKQAAINMFNDRAKERFVFLIENHACHSSIHLSSIDGIIIYGSDWNPLNDLKALGKIQIESQAEHVSIFRLYTPFTVEEKGLMLAKQGVIIDCKIQDIEPSLSHGLLSWGVSCMFSRLDELHQGNPSKSSERGKLCMDKVVSEFLTVLSTHSNAATISKAYKSGEFYSRNITLMGESEGASSLDADPPRFWLNLLDGKSPCCHLSESPQVKQRNSRGMEKLTNDPDEETNKGRREHGKTGVGSSSKSSSDVLSNNDVSPEITPPADLQLLDGTQQKLGTGNLSTPKSLHVQLKCELSKLIKVLELPDNVQLLAEQLHEYLLKNHLVVREPRGILHAFNIALCWRAASLLKYKKLDRSYSLKLAASSLNYEHNEGLARKFYEKLEILKEKVQHKTDKNSNKVDTDMFLSEESSSTNLRNCHVFSKQAMDLHGNLTNSSPREGSSGAEKIVSDGQDQIVSDGTAISPPEANRKCHFSSGEHPDMIMKSRLDLFDKAFSVREKNILEKQHLEISDFQRYRESQVIKLKEIRSLVLRHIQRSSFDAGSINDQIKLMVEWFTMLLYSFLKHMRLQLNNLEALQSETWFKDRLMKEKLKENLVSGQLYLDQCLDLCTALPDSNFVIEEFVHFKKILALGCDQLSDDRLIPEITLVRNAVPYDRLIPEITLVQNAVPSEAISTRSVGNEPVEALVSFGGASASEFGYLPEKDINCSSDGIELRRACSSIVPTSHDNQLSSVSSQRSTDAPSGHQSVETESTGMLGTQTEQDLCPGMQLSTSFLYVAPQRAFTDDKSQPGCQLDKSTDLSDEGETEYPTCATHDLSALSLSREAEIDNGQKSVPAQQSKSTRTQESLAAFQHPPGEAESAGIRGKLLPDDLHQSTSVQIQSAEAKQASVLGIKEAQNLQHETQPSTTTKDVSLERTDLSGVLLMQSPTVLHDAEPSGTSNIAAAPNLMPEIQSPSSMQDGQMGAERPGTSGTIAPQDLQPETLPSVSVQHIPPEGTHSDDMIQISPPGQQSTGLDSQQSVAAPWQPAEQEEPAGILGVVLADAFQPSTMMVNQTSETERASSLDAVGTQDSHAELLPSTTAHDVPCEETDLSGMPVPQGTTSQQSLEVSLDTHAEREPANTLGTLVAHDVQSGMQPLSSVQDQCVEAEGAGQSDTIAAEDLQPGTEPSTVMHHITPGRTHPGERIQMSHQPNETRSQMSLQPNEAPISQMLAQFFSVGPAGFNNLIHSSEPLRNELAKLKCCSTELAKRHEEKKLILQAEYKKEMEKLNRKYESLCHKEDSAYHQMASQLDGIYYKVSMHQIVAENFRAQLTQLNASQERSAGPTNGQVPQTSQQAPSRTSGAQTTASLVTSLSATQPPVPSSSHSTGSLRSGALQPTLPGNLYRASSSPASPIPLPNGSYWAAGAQSRGPAPPLQHLRMPQPYAGFSLPRHPAPGMLTSPLAGLPVTSIPSTSVRQTMASASNSDPALPAASPLSGSLAESVGGFGATSSTDPVVMAGQQNVDAAAGIWHAGAHIAGVANPVFESSSETLQRWHPVMARSVSPPILSSSAHPSASNLQPALATSSANPFIRAGQQGPIPNPAFHNNSVPLNAAAGIRHTVTHTSVANQPVPESALMNAWPAGRTGVTREPSPVVCLSDDE